MPSAKKFTFWPGAGAEDGKKTKLKPYTVKAKSNKKLVNLDNNLLLFLKI